MPELSFLTEWLPLIVAGAGGLLLGALFASTANRLRKPKASAPKPNKAVSQRRQTIQRKFQHSERLSEVYKMLINLTATLSYQRVLDKALDLSMQALISPTDTNDRLVSAVLLFAQETSQEPELTVAVSRRFTRTDQGSTFPANEGLLKNAIEEGGGILGQDLSQDPELGRVLSLQTCRSAYIIPLRQGFDTYGVVIFGHPEPSFFSAESREILDIICNQAMVAIQNARLYQDLEQEKERMMEIQEEARKKLARNLHDGPTQSVAAIAMRVNFARRLMERDAAASADELYKIEELARRTTKEIRHMLFTLRPLVLESQGLTAAVQSMADKLAETYEQNVLIDIDGSIEDELEMGKQGVVFAIIEEATNNARKYAEAEHIWIRLKTIQNDLAVLEIQDDGVGFDVGAVDASYDNRGSLGMVNMRERAELVNGLLNIQAAVGKGTHIQAVIPLTEAAADKLHRGV